MDGGSSASTQFIVGKLSCNRTLEQVGVADAEVASLPGLTLEGQGRGRVGGGEHHQASTTDGRHSRSGSAGAVGADYAQDGGVSGHFGSSGLSTFGGAQGIFAGELNCMTKQFPAAVINSNFDCTFGIFAQEGGSARDGQHVGNVNRLIGCNVNTANCVGAFKSHGFFCHFFFGCGGFFGGWSFFGCGGFFGCRSFRGRTTGYEQHAGDDQQR